LEISWLLPVALLGIAALVWLTRGAPRQDRLRAALVVWGGSLLVTAGVFSFMQGTIHPYYSVALAPSVAALVALAGTQLWRRRGVVADGGLAVMVLAAAGWAEVLLRRSDTGTTSEVVVAGLAVLALVGIALRATGVRLSRRLAPAILLAVVLAVSAPTASWAARTAATVHTGSIPTAVSTGSTGDRTGGPGGGSDDGGSTSSALTAALQASTSRWAAATVGSQTAASLMLDSDTAVMAIGGFTGSDASPTLAQFKAYVAAGDIHYFVVGGGAAAGGATGGSQGAPTGGSAGAPTGGSTGAPTGQPPSGAPSGTRPSRGAGGGASSGTGSAITTWVKANFTSTTIGGTTVYDLTNPK
jgi:4-amino-4-deoxy-L-arabinose transferase-like glycosyltransferase